MQVSKKTGRIVFTGVFSALALVLYFLEFPIFSGYLQIDFSDVPAVLAGVLVGPGAAVAVELIKNLIHVVIKGLGSTMGYGDLMNFIVGTALTVPYAAVMRRMLSKGKRPASAALPAGLAGLGAMVLAGVIGNYLLAPPFFGAVMHVSLSGAALWAAVGSATLLNLIKSVIAGAVTPPIVAAGRRYISALK